MSSSNCCFLTCMQISQEAGKVVWYSHLFKNFPEFVVFHRVKGFSIVNEVEVGAFLKFPCFFHEPTDVDNLTSGSSAFSESSLYIWKFSVGVLLKPSLKDFEHYLASTWNEHNCKVVWIFFRIGMKIYLFQSMATAKISKLAGMWNEYSCMVIWTFFSIAFLWYCNETDHFQSCGRCWIFQFCWHIECSTFTASYLGFEMA